MKEKMYSHEEIKKMLLMRIEYAIEEYLKNNIDGFKASAELYYSKADDRICMANLMGFISDNEAEKLQKRLNG
jgi:hypothetical protein